MEFILRNCDYLNFENVLEKLVKRLSFNFEDKSNFIYNKNQMNIVNVLNFNFLSMNTILYDFAKLVLYCCFEFSDLNFDQDADFLFNNFIAFSHGFFNKLNIKVTLLEKDNFINAMIYILYLDVINYMIDFLNGDAIYECKVPKQNLFRVKNRIRCILIIVSKQEYLKAIIYKCIDY